MAFIQVGKANSSISFEGGDLPRVLNVTHWNFIASANGGSYSFGVLDSYSQQLSYVTNASGVITSVSFVTSSLGGAVLPVTFSGLSIPLSAFRSSLANVMSLLTGGDDVITGNGTRQVISAGAGNDVIYGGNGSDQMFGDDGNDQFMFTTDFSGVARDVADGGSGTDTVNFSQLSGGLNIALASIAFDRIGNQVSLVSVENAEGSNYDDTVTGTDAANRIIANGGADVVYGGAGSDTLYGGAGNDALYGGNGDDLLLPGLSTAMASSVDLADGGAGNDTVSFADVNLRPVTIDLTAGRAFEPARGSNFIGVSANLVSIENAVGSQGNDIIKGNAAANRLDGYLGDDWVNGYAGDDIIGGGEGHDALLGGLGNDALYGGNGNDILRGELGSDILDGGAGVDIADYRSSTATVDVDLSLGLGYGGDAHGDRLSNIEDLFGSAFADILTGSAGANGVWAGAGNDRIYGLDGTDALYGEAGDDTVFGGAGGDKAEGGLGNDGLFGDAGNDQLFGGDGNDYISGGDGNDVIFGDAGNDQMLGGAGDDFVVLGLGDDGVTLGAGRDLVRFDYGNGRDTVLDFKSGEDRLDFTHTDLTRAVIQANAFETAAGVLLQLGSGSVLLSNLHLADLNWNADFLFA